jgi:hypothetical protein
MTWNSEWNMAVSWMIVLVLVPILIKGHKNAHEESKKRMPEGLLKWLVTHEFCKRTPSVSADVRTIGKRTL